MTSRRVASPWAKPSNLVSGFGHDNKAQLFWELLALWESNMCTTGVSYQVMTDPVIQDIVSRKELDFLHQQVIMVLYTLQHEKRLHDYRQMLPIYLGRDWDACERLLAVLESAGVVRRVGTDIELPYEVHIDDAGDACACGI